MQRKSFFRFIRLFVLISLVISINPVAYVTVLAAPAQTTTDFTFTPVADTYVDSSRAKFNYGSSTSLRTDASPVVNSYLRFSVQGLSGQVSQARLMIYATSSSTREVVAQAVADNSWGETTLNYRNAPSLGNTLASSPSVSGGTWVTLDVTSYITGNGTFSFGVTTPGSTAISLESRESGANSPKLIVSISGSSIPGGNTIPTAVNTATPVVIPPSPTATVVSKATPTIIPPSPTATAATVVIPPSPTATFTRTPAIAPTNTSTPSSTPATNAAYRTWYVDNSVLVSGDGSSWNKSWKSFSLINWNTINPGDTIYISGGSNSQTYNETLTIAKSGSSGKYINIDVGANSPSPLGHDGTAIIDGGGTRKWGILFSNLSYVQINGYDSKNNYKLKVQNTIQTDAAGAGIYVYNSSYIYIDHIQVNNATNRGIFLNTCNNCRVRGNDVETGSVDTNYETDNFYISYGSDVIVENNIAIQGNADSHQQHVDTMQFNEDTRLTVRSNWMEWLPVAVDPNEVGFIIGSTHDWSHIYNNVIIGSHADQEKAIFVYAAATDGLYYFWNNTFITKNPTGGVVEFFGWDRDYLGEFKNNIIYSPGGFAYIVGNITAFSPASKINNNCIYGSTTSGLTWWNTNGTRSWAQWQAAGYDVNSVNANPLFISNFTNLHLQNTSPCKDAGADLSAYFNTDKDGTIRPQGTGFDVGAFEYSGGQ